MKGRECLQRINTLACRIDFSDLLFPGMLEKEATMKGMAFGQAHGFEIPPPRPKRRPNSPYPRKNGASSLSPLVEMMDGKTSQPSSTLFHDKQATDIENNSTCKIHGMKDKSEDGNCSEVLNLFQDAPSSSFNGLHPLKLHVKDNTAQGSLTSFDANKASEAASMDSSSSETLHGRISSSTNPRMAAFAAAIVSAAAAWWETQGLLPNYPSLHTDFKLAPDDKKEGREDTCQNSLVIDQKNADSEQSEAPRYQLPNLKSLTLSPSSNSEASGRGEPMDHANTNRSKPLLSNGAHKSDKARNKKRPDGSSCGSNAQSINEVETDRVLMKNQDEKESEKVRLSSPPLAEKNTRRTRSNVSMNESWKKVSEEGRLNFEALLTREIMPQSFVLPHAKESEAMTEDKGKEAISEPPAVDLNVESSTSEPTNLYYLQGFCVASAFRPYKRCLAESKEKRAAGSDDVRKKKIRLEGETSI